MSKVTIELWLWLGKELKCDFEQLSEMRSRREEEVKEGTTIRALLESLAKRYPAIARDVFDLSERRAYPHVVINYNDRVLNPHMVHDQVLTNGDKVTLLPMYAGG
jgi:molybdopterin converting factor small subunit